MEEFQNVGNELGKAITEGNIDKAIKLIQTAVTLDAEFEVYLQPKNEIVYENHGPKEYSKNVEIQEKLLEMGIDKRKAMEIAKESANIEEAITKAFQV